MNELFDFETKMSHPELCRITAEKFVKASRFALWEYQSFASLEFPDVLVYGKSKTTLYEIKMSRNDFFADSKKESRIKWKAAYSWEKTAEKYRIEKPHLGSARYFVCPADLIKENELPDGWGLYWFKNGKFYKKKDSGKFRADVRTERDLAAHAFQRYASGIKTGIIINTYDTGTEL
jgi:hypothetical protein